MNDPRAPAEETVSFMTCPWKSCTCTSSVLYQSFNSVLTQSPNFKRMRLAGNRSWKLASTNGFEFSLLKVKRHNSVVNLSSRILGECLNFMFE